MKNDQWHREACRYCGDELPYQRAHGLCDEHWRMGVLVWSRAENGDYLCPVCRLEGEQTTLPHDREVKNEHFEEDHGFPMHDRMALIREKERLFKRLERDDEQTGLPSY
jgi:hypothetical protein